MNRVYQILSLDGGGMKGVFQASFLASVEEALGKPIANYFDLIVGTSTGGIIALGLGAGFSAKDMLNFYEQCGPEIFEVRRLSWLRKWFSCQYDQQKLKTALENKLGKNTLLGQSKKRLVIPTFNLDTGKVNVYKTAHHQRFERDYRQNIVEIALATSAAPTYFQALKGSKGISLIDGGIYANNPVGLAAVEAIGVLEWPRDKLRILSLGCTEESLDIRKYRKGLFYWALNAKDVFLQAQSSLSLGTTQLLAGHDNILRVNTTVPRNKFKLDKVSEIDALRGLGDSEARQNLPKLRQMFNFKDDADKFDPYHKL